MDIRLQSHGHFPERSFPIGVVIPTFNRPDTIQLCLEHLERQTWTDFEVIVVDDGSTDSTPQILKEYLRSSPLNVRCIRQANGGASKARNAAIASLQAPVCLMIGDDILVSPDAVRIHLTLHEQKLERNVACLGLTRWSDSGQRVTNFMRWLENSGNQFAYGDLLAGMKADWRHFYTSNISLKTDFLRQNPFDESFPKCNMEDIELGYRLSVRHGLEVVFLPEALAHHIHPITFRRSCRRALDVGLANRRFHELWPDCVPAPESQLKQFVRNFAVKNAWLLPPLTTISDILTRVWCPNPLMRATLSSYYSIGYSSYSHSEKNESAIL